MRAILFVVVGVLCSGCKTAELAVTHATTGMHLVARIEAKEDRPAASALGSKSLVGQPAMGPTLLGQNAQGQPAAGQAAGDKPALAAAKAPEQVAAVRVP